VHRSDLAAMTANLQQTTTSLSVIEGRLDSLASPKMSHPSNRIQGPRPVFGHDLASEESQSVALSGRMSTPLLPRQKHTLTVNQMVTELHRCLVLGVSPTSIASSSFQNTSNDETARVVRP
jgi:hypothetical protein